MTLAAYAEALVHGELLALDTHPRPLLQRPRPLRREVGTADGAAAHHLECRVVPAQCIGAGVHGAQYVVPHNI